MRYPELAKELVSILEEDQHEIREHSKLYKRNPKSPEIARSRRRLTSQHARRAARILDILQEIKEPSLSNIGVVGSEAMIVVALHAKYNAMKQVFDAFAAVYQAKPKDVYLEGIPALTDRIRMLERKKQLFGTQWLVNSGDTFFLYPVEDFEHMNEHRAVFGLEVARRPRDLTYGIPDGPPPPETVESDQREPTEEEYQQQLKELFD